MASILGVADVNERGGNAVSDIPWVWPFASSFQAAVTRCSDDKHSCILRRNATFTPARRVGGINVNSDAGSIIPLVILASLT